MKSVNANTSRMMAGSANPASKKLVIKPFAVQPKLPQNFFEQTWAKLRDAIVAIYAKNASALSKEELYRAVEDLCLHKHSQQLYDELSKELRQHIVKRVALLQASQSIDAKDFLAVLEQAWIDICEQLGTVRNVFLYLDRSFACKSQQGAKSIWDLGLSMCRQTLDTMPELLAKIVSSLVGAVDSLRNGDNSQKDLLSRCAQMLISLDLYVSLFEPTFLQDAKRFFAEEGQSAIISLDAARFLALVERRLYEAHELCTQYLDLRSKRALTEIVESLLLKPHVHTLLERESAGFRSLLEEDKRDDLKRMFILFEKVDELDSLKTSFALFVRQSGESIISAHISSASSSSGAPSGPPSTEKDFVESLLSLLQKIDGILQYSFSNRDSFALALKLAFENILNLQQKQTAEQLARYVDKKMRGEKGVTEAEIEILLDQVLKLFKFLQEKDLFEAFYKKFLSKRLLLNKSASHEVEKNILAKLKAECGPAFTAKLEGMFTDTELSKQCVVSYQNHLRLVAPSGDGIRSSNRVWDPLQEREYGEPELALQLLTAGNWPSVPACPSLKIPSELKLLMQRFEQFYHGAYQGRKLVWSHSLERCLVGAKFPKGKKDLEVSLFQALVLRCFNASERLTLPEIRQNTGIETDELRRTLQSLACGLVGTRVLSKEPKGKDVADSDLFTVNLDFSNKLFRVKINTIQAKEETNEETQKTLEEVARDRTYQIDAAVVRVMKSRKRLSHSQLISEVMSQLRFPAINVDIKKRIESLIERDYLERDPEDNAFYKYLA